MCITPLLLLAAAAIYAEAGNLYGPPSLGGFWPLNERFQGVNIASTTPDTDLVLNNISFGAGDARWKSPPADFIRAQDSYAEVADTANVAITRSFSWIAAVKRRASTNGALIEWDDGGQVSTHVWVWENKLYINLLREGCRNSPIFYSSSTIQNDRWTIVAVIYDADTSKLSMYVDGQPQDTALDTCAGNTKTGSVFRINKRLGTIVYGNLHFDAEITCMGLFNQVVDYEMMTTNVIAKC